MKLLNLIPDWKQVWKKAWSVRLSLLAAVASGGEVAFSVWVDGRPAYLAGAAFVVSLSAGIARIIAQPKMHQ